MKKKKIIVNSIAIGICVLFLLGNLFDVLIDGPSDTLGRISSNMIYLCVKVIMFSIGLILMNIQIRKDKMKLAITLLAIFIISGIVVGNLAYDKYNEITSDTDWFSDGVN